MTRNDFDKVIEKRIKAIKETLVNKGNEYALTDDVFHNFRAAARMSVDATSPAVALWGMFAKHLVSLADLARGKSASVATIDEKIGDAVNYLILLEGILKEREVKP